MKPFIALVLVAFAGLCAFRFDDAFAQKHRFPNDPQPIYEIFGGTPIPPEQAPVTLNSDYGGLKPGVGREETFYACGGCHSLGRIVTSSKSREEWVATFDQLSAERRMPEFDEDERDIIFDYLAENYGPN